MSDCDSTTFMFTYVYYNATIDAIDASQNGKQNIWLHRDSDNLYNKSGCPCTIQVLIREKEKGRSRAGGIHLGYNEKMITEVRDVDST